MREFAILGASMLLLGGCYLFHRASGDERLPVDTPDWLFDAGLPADDASTRDERCTTRSLRAGERFDMALDFNGNSPLQLKLLTR